MVAQPETRPQGIVWTRTRDENGLRWTATYGAYKAELQFTPAGVIAYTLSQGPVIWKQGTIPATLSEVKAEAATWMLGYTCAL